MDYCGDYMSLMSSSTRTNMYFKAKKKRFLFNRNIYSITMVLFFVVGVFYFSVCVSNYFSFRFVSSCSSPSSNSSQVTQGNFFDLNLYKVLENASTKDKTVIITSVNEAWAKEDSLLDLFMESIRTGNGTLKYLNHLMIICIDQKAYERCLTVHRHCYKLNSTTTDDGNGSSEAYYMTKSYLKIVWNQVQLMKIVLEMGFNFLVTDCDIMWLQDPFARFFPEGDIQISCDEFTGNPYDGNNFPNPGFQYARSNDRTIQFYKFWYASRLLHRGKRNQPVFNIARRHPYIIDKIRLKFVFLDTKYFGGFCQPTKDISQACTIHANCCFGLQNKISDLKLVLQDWRNYSSLPPSQRSNASFSSPSRAPLNCVRNEYKPPKSISSSKRKGKKNHGHL